MMGQAGSLTDRETRCDNLGGSFHGSLDASIKGDDGHLRRQFGSQP
jgi:hypothetical protein